MGHRQVNERDRGWTSWRTGWKKVLAATTGQGWQGGRVLTGRQVEHPKATMTVGQQTFLKVCFPAPAGIKAMGVPTPLSRGPVTGQIARGEQNL
jgi:hypothetical protein